jgi:ABC-type branched-subunit amino acid transport system substrate-binding protein
VQPGRDEQDDGLFDGSEEIIAMIGELYVRRSPDEPLPILSLVRPDLDEHPRFLAYIFQFWLEGTEPCVPHAYVDLKTAPGQPDTPDVELPEATQDDVERVQEILLKLAPRLEERPGGRFRLDRFRDVVWLMSQTLPSEPAHKRHAELRKRLRRRARGKLDDAAEAVKAQPHLPGWVGWLSWLLGGLLTPLWYRARHSGRVWPISGRYRWFLRQPNLAPGEGSFIDLATKLTADEWRRQVPEQVLRIMVNSLLEDLRAAFRGKGFFKKRMTAYPVVLLNHVTRANGGYHLLRVVNDIRNDTGLLDPMLLVTCSKRMPPHAFEPDYRPAHPGVFNAVDSTAILSAWKNSISARQQSRSDVAWYLCILLSEPADSDTRRRISLRLAALPPFALPPVPIWRKQAATMTLVIFLLGIATVGYIKLGLDDSYHHCGSGFTWFGFQSRNADIVRIEGECVGVTDGSNAAFLPSDPAFKQISTTILEQNRETEKRHRDQPARPLITVVHVDTLTSPGSSNQSDSLFSARERLAGVAVAQHEQLDKDQQSDPLVRVLIARAGHRTRHGVKVAGMIGELARLDRSIVAVIGFNESRQTTIKMINSLATEGLPVVAATLSADELVNNRMYFQVAPQNQRQAEVAAAYAAQRRDSEVQHNRGRLASSVRIYFSDDPEDIWSKNLAEDLAESFERRKFTVESLQFTPDGNPQGKNERTPRSLADSKEAGRDACGFDGVVFYAGRSLPDYRGFLGGMSDRCKNSPPLVIAGDDVAAYVAIEDIRTQNSIPFNYISFAISPDVTNNAKPPKGFYEKLDKMFPAAKGRSLNGHAALTYDATYAAITAAGYLATGNEKIPITGGTLWWALASITDDQGTHKKYEGVTGAIDFGGVVSRRVPLNKPISILQVESGKPNANERGFCGSRDDPSTQPWCPFDN